MGGSLSSSMSLAIGGTCSVRDSELPIGGAGTQRSCGACVHVGRDVWTAVARIGRRWAKVGWGGTSRAGTDRVAQRRWIQ